MVDNLTRHARRFLLLFLSLLAEQEGLPFRETGTEQDVFPSLIRLGSYAWGFSYGNPYPQGGYDL